MSISFNGQEYSSVDDMPPEVRQAYESVMNIFADANRDGTPDIFQSGGGINVVHEGKVYTNVNDLPPELRAKYDEAIHKVAASGLAGIPGKVNVQTAEKVWVGDKTSEPSFPLMPAALSLPPSLPSTPRNSTVLMLGIVIAFLLLVIAILLTFLVVKPF